MSPEAKNTKTTTLVPIDPNSSALVETEKPDHRDEIMRETEALVQAFQQRLQAEMQAAGNLTREAYLNAIKQFRQMVEQEPFLSPDRMEESVQLFQKQAERNWLVINGELESIGVRFADAARTIWKELSNSSSNSTKS